MASIFCPSCGSKSEYKFAIPNFCYKCGSSYSQTLSFKKNTPSQISEEVDVDENDDSEDFEEFSNSARVPKIIRLQVDIDSSTDVKVLKFQDIANNLSSPFKRPKNLDIGNI